MAAVNNNRTPRPKEDKTLDKYRKEIIRLWKDEKKPLRTVMRHIEKNYGFKASDRHYKTKLAKWKAWKNVKGTEVAAILAQQRQRRMMGIDSEFTLGNHLIDMEQVLRHSSRYRISPPTVNHTSPNQYVIARGLGCKTPPPIDRCLATSQRWRTHEKFIADVNLYITSSFEPDDAGYVAWAAEGSEQLIRSSREQSSEKEALHTFIGDLDICSTNIAMGRIELGEAYRKSAFREIGKLVQGSYHDTIPNMIQKINDLNDRNHPELAEALKMQISNSSAIFCAPNGLRASIFSAFKHIELGDMEDMCEIIMGRYVELFDQYVGKHHYNSFVMMINAAKRRLLRNRMINFEDCSPDPQTLVLAFGCTNRRSLDALRLRAEVLSEREMYLEAEQVSTLLIERADAVQSDEWIRLYFLIKGWFYKSGAQYHQGRDGLALTSLARCNSLMLRFCAQEPETINHFDSERVLVLERMAELNARLPGRALLYEYTPMF